MVPYIGKTDNESAYSGSPLIVSFSNEKNMGTFSIFLIFTISLFFPLNSNGPKFTLPTSKNTLGSTTEPTIRKF
jgi:hypothetical protein